MRRLIPLILLLMIAILMRTNPAQAQDNIYLESLNIILEPEFDQHAMLVIYTAIIPPNEAKTPLTFTIPINVDGMRPYKVASSIDGNLYETPYTLDVGSNWIEVNFTPNSTFFQIEYYDRLEIFGSSRSFEYTWPGDYAVNDATIVVQQPLDASHMQFIPPVSTSFQGDDGLTYFRQQLGNLDAGQTYSLSIKYQKSTNTLTNDKLEVRPSGSLPQSMWIRGLPWALGVLALVLIGGGVLVYWRSGLPRSQASDKKHRRRKKALASGSEVSDETGVYCHSCGRRASTSDLFCRSCGTQLRI